MDREDKIKALQGLMDGTKRPEDLIPQRFRMFITYDEGWLCMGPDPDLRGKIFTKEQAEALRNVPVKFHNGYEPGKNVTFKGRNPIR